MTSAAPYWRSAGTGKVGAAPGRGVGGPGGRAAGGARHGRRGRGSRQEEGAGAVL